MSNLQTNPEPERLHTVQDLNNAIIDSLEENGLKKEDLFQKRLAREVFTYMVREGNVAEATTESVRNAVKTVLQSKEKKIKQP